VTGVTISGSHFTLKTETMGDYEFNTTGVDQAKKWKKEIDTRVEQSKLTRSGVQENDKYLESFAYFKDMHSKGTFESIKLVSNKSWP
jgi:hypothetical protein